MDDEDRNFTIGGNHHGPRHAGLYVGPMAALLSIEPKAGGLKTFSSVRQSCGVKRGMRTHAASRAECFSTPTQSGLRHWPALKE